MGISGLAEGKDTTGDIIKYLTSECASKRTFEQFKRGNPNPDAFGLHYASDWEIKKFAAKLKQVASLMLNIPTEKFEDQEFKKTFLPKEWNTLTSFAFDGPYSSTSYEETPMTVREFLQKLGTEAIRDGLHRNSWVNSLFSDYVAEPVEGGFSRTIKDENGIVYDYEFEVEYPKWIVTDTRFPNEAQAIKDRGGIVIRINRDLTKADYATLEERHPSETSLDNWDFDYVIDNSKGLNELQEEVYEMLIFFGIV